MGNLGQLNASLSVSFSNRSCKETSCSAVNPAADGLDNQMKLAKKHKVKVLFGTDFVGSMELKKLQNVEFTNRTKWFSNAEILKQATSINAEILALSGPRNPYPGELGVIAEGAYADLLLINGNPIEDILILTKPEENLALIMKDGKIYKNTVTTQEIQNIAYY